jgi:hypothetical protein
MEVVREAAAAQYYSDAGVRSSCHASIASVLRGFLRRRRVAARHAQARQSTRLRLKS